MSAFPVMSFPSDNEVASCGPWCRPIHMVADAIAGEPFAKYFHIEDFMCMGKLHRKGRPDLILNKHYHTRFYLNLDEHGHAYRYLAPPEHSDSNGQYRPYRDVVEAIDHLRLFEMPWLVGSGHADDRLGLNWSERWTHPDVIAWYDRADARRVAKRPKRNAS